MEDNLEELLELNKQNLEDPIKTNYWLEVFDLQPIDYELEPPHAGMPKKFKTSASMAIMIAEYFLEQDMKELPYTMYGLALRLGYYNELSALNRYQGYGEKYKRIIKIAQAIVLQGYEQRLSLKGMGNGVQFALMNLGNWSRNEKQEVTHKDLTISFKQQENITTETDEESENSV